MAGMRQVPRGGNMDTAGSDTPDGKAPGDDAKDDVQAGPEAEQPAPQLRRDQLPVHEQIAAYIHESEGREQPTGDSVAAYYAAPLPERGKVAGRQTNWLLICSVIFVVMVASLGLVGWQAYRWAKSIGIVQNIPPAAVLVGTPLSWTELDSWPSIQESTSPMASNGLVPGDFDSDGDQELLVYLWSATSYQWPQSANIYELDGSISLVTLPAQNHYDSVWAWDCDGNGTDEIVMVDQSGANVYDRTGTLLSSIAGKYALAYTDGKLILADVNGDGISEVLLFDLLSNNKIVAYDHQGQVVWDQELDDGYSLQFSAGDVDGDGLDELVCILGGSTLLACGQSQEAVPINGWAAAVSYQPGRSTFMVLHCTDLNGDGTDEIIDPTLGYIDPAAGTYTPFLLPLSSTGAMLGVSPGLQMGSRIAVYDFDADGALNVAILHSPQSTAMQATAICIFDLSGALVYHEEFGEEVYGVAVAQSGGQEHLAVLTASRLLVYP